MQLAPRTEEFLNEDRRWIGDSKKLRADRTIIASPALFSPAAFPGGVVKSGTVLVRNDAGIWGPSDPAATDGRQTPDSDNTGVLYTTTVLRADGGNAALPLYDNGAINVAFLPVAAGPGSLNAAAKSAMASHFRFYA